MSATSEELVPTVDASGEPIHFPFDEDFQSGLTALALRDTAFMRRCSHLLFPSHFDNIGNAGAVQIALRHFKTYGTAIDKASLKLAVADAIAKKIIGDGEKAIVVETIKQAFTDGLPSAAPIEAKLAEFARHQAVTAAILKSAEALNKDDFDGIESAMKKALDVGANEEGDAYDYYAEIESRTTERKDKVAGVNPPRGITTGVMGLDDVLYHRGWGRKEMSVLMAGAKQGKCIVPSSLIFTDDGLVEIGDYIPDTLGDDQYQEHEMMVLGRNGMEKTSHVYNSGLTKTKRVTTQRLGLEIEGTWHHPMLVTKPDGSFVWKKLEDLEVGDYMVVQRGAQVYGNDIDLSDAQAVAIKRFETSSRPWNINLPTLPSVMTADFAEWLGMFVAEGHIRSEKSICFTQKDEEIANRFATLTRSLFGIDARVYFYENKNAYDVEVSNVVIATYLRAIGVVDGVSALKEIPSAVRRAPKECVTRFVGAVLGLEGNVRQNRSNTYCYDISMASKKIIRQLQMLLLNEGICAHFSTKESMATNGKCIRRTYYRLQIQNANSLIRLRDVFGLYEKRKNAVLERVKAINATARDPFPFDDLIKRVVTDVRNSNMRVYDVFGKNFWHQLCANLRGDQKRRISHYQANRLVLIANEHGLTSEALERLNEILLHNYGYDQVNSIEDSEAVTVDLSVPNTHSFFANGLIAHNTLAMINFAGNATQHGYNVLYATLEVSARIIAERLDAFLSDTPIRSLEDNIISVKDKINLKAAKAGRFLIHEFPSGTMTPRMLRKLIEKYRNRGLIFDLVVVDYADIMAPDYRTDNVIENSKEIYVGLRALAFEFDCAILTATQTNREGYKAAVAKAEHVAEDFNKIRTADVVISINSTEEERDQGEARLYFAASRNQESGFTVRVKQDLKKMQFITNVIGIE